MKIAIIDLGTNTFNLLIVEKKSMGFQQLYNTKQAVMLGKEGFVDGNISTEAYERAYRTLQYFHQQIKAHNCTQIKALGTSAIRSAKNSRPFIERVNSDFKITIEPISGEQEATYIYYGAKAALPFTDENFLILDIGGGSNEFIIANKHKLLWKHSFNLGGARMLEKFKPQDPVLPGEINEIQHFFQQELRLLTEQIQKHSVARLVGCSGAFDCFASMIHHNKFHRDPDLNQKRYDFTLQEFEQMAKPLLQSSRKQRLTIPGIDPVRVDTIVMATIFTQLVLKITNIELITQSAYSLKEGVASQI